MDESERSDFQVLVKILDEELETQFGIDRVHDTPKKPVGCSLRYWQMR